MTYVIKLKRTTKGFETEGERTFLNSTSIDYGEAIFLEKYGYLAIGKSYTSDDNKTKIGSARVFKAVPREMADKGIFFDTVSTVSGYNFVNLQSISYDYGAYTTSVQTVYPRTKFDAVTDSNNVTLTTHVNNINSNKMDKSNPTGTGSLSINRKSDTTTGNYSTTENYNNEASGTYSHAEGNSTQASASAAHAEGLGTIAQRDNQHVSGKYNVADTDSGGKYALIVGNGTSSSNRKNAMTLDWDGNLYLQGNVYVEGSNTDASGGSNVVTFSNADDIYEWQRFKTSFSQSSSSTSELYVCGYGYAAQTLSTTVYYGTTYTRDDQYGTYSINNPTKTTVSSPSAGVTLFDNMPVNSWFTIHPHSRNLYKKTSSTTYTKDSNTCMFNNLTRYWISDFKVNNFEVLRSNSSSTYPTSGLHDGYYYIYIGKSGDRHVFTIENPECSTKYPGNVIKLPILNSQFVDISQVTAVSASMNMLPQWLISGVSLKIVGLGQSGSNQSVSWMSPSGESTIVWGDKNASIETTGFDLDSRYTSVNIIPYLGLQRAGDIHVIY